MNDNLYTCEQCGKVKEADMPCHKMRFCSRQCSNKWNWNKRLDKGKEIECTMLCGNYLWIRKGEMTDDGRPIHSKFCSQKCFGKYRKQIYMPFLKPFKKGKPSWNKGITMDIEFRVKCKIRAEYQWKDLDYREKQMKRDFTKLGIIGTRALKEYWSHPENAKKRWTGKDIQKKYLEKIGVKNGRSN